jgi:hypothetical protein
MAQCCRSSPTPRPRQCVEEGHSGRVGLQHCGDVIGKIAALRAFRRQFNEHIGAGCDAMPPILAGFRVNARPLSPGVIVTRTPLAVDRAVDVMLSFGTHFLSGPNGTAIIARPAGMPVILGRDHRG